jgi:hypothetical protein
MQISKAKKVEMSFKKAIGVILSSKYEDDEAFTHTLQDAEERDVADRPMALIGIDDCECTD